MQPLAAERCGGGEKLAVLLHGFGATRAYWRPVIPAIAQAARVVAFDLPGHGESLDHPGRTRTAAMADAVIGELERAGESRVHLAGHSMGGAVACLVALKRPGLVASLTLMAPGGFGLDIAADVLRQYAAAATADDIASALAAMHASGVAPREAFAAALADKSRPGVAERHQAIASSFLRGDRQGVLPLAALAATGVPVSVVWGRRDRITPVRQALGLPSRFRVTILENAGHSLADEAPEAVASAILQSISRRSADGAS